MGIPLSDYPNDDLRIRSTGKANIVGKIVLTLRFLGTVSSKKGSSSSSPSSVVGGDDSDKGGDGVPQLWVGEREEATPIPTLPLAHDHTPDDTDEPPDMHSFNIPAKKWKIYKKLNSFKIISKIK